MQKETLLTLSETDESPFTFSLFVSRQEVGIHLTEVISLKKGSISTSFREEIQIQNESELKQGALNLFSKLSEKVLQKYPDEHPHHNTTSAFLNNILERIHSL